MLNGKQERFNIDQPLDLLLMTQILEAKMEGKGIVNCATVEESGAEANKKLLHGTLEATIFHATVRKKPSFTHNCFSLNGNPAYVEIKLNQETVATTSHEKDRVWNQTFQILCAHPLDSTITIHLKTKCSLLRNITFKARRLVEEASFISGFFPLLKAQGTKKPSGKLQLQLVLWFKPAEFEPRWGKLIDHGGFHGLRNSTFPQRSNCGVTLYHDAHHHASFGPPFPGLTTPRNLWEDVYRALEGAKHLIYIAGWSLNPNLVLIREETQRGAGVKLGDLLKHKAEEGVAVRVMIWNDETSIPLIKNKGLMRTHDEDALVYFRNTKVVCRLCPRLHNKLPTFFSHHQKTITVDTRIGIDGDSSISHREITSFVGGVDLCDGRYDTEEHSLFRTLNTSSHCNDFYQTSIRGASLPKGGPREPWHDSHARVTGEAAWDVLTNFEQRWTKQCDPRLLVPVNTIGSLHRDVSPMGGHRNWKVQVFRSIDHFSADPVSSRASMTEQSIHEAYVEAIRRADRFIYIENQYFVGGCSLWAHDQHCGCKNLIPIEIALKIANKIRARERFAAYVVIPMWPEGVPESDSVEDILHWTRTTMGMMYGIIGQALKESGGPGHPKDYLNFFCLANREEKVDGEFIPPLSPLPCTQYCNAQKNRRFMIYVHSKLMIVDDIYMIIGSANVNQRSMDGARDTEIAIGCHQSGYGGSQEIASYRMSLWYEHTGGGAEETTFLQPESLECVERMRSTGEKMWKVYSGDEIVDMKGVHLVSYPLSVSQDGCLKDSDASTLFPDTHTPVIGRRSKILPPILTT